MDFACRRLGFRGAGGSDFFSVASAGNNSGEENEEGLSEGREEVRARLVGWILSTRLRSWEGDLIRAGLLGKKFLEESLLWGVRFLLG